MSRTAFLQARGARLLTNVTLSALIDRVTFERSNQRAGSARVSVYDVAAAAGVSHQTVSNVLNYPERVRPATRERVESAVKKLGYEVNAAARSLGAGRTNVLGLQVPRRGPGDTPGFFEHFTLELADAARARDHNILIYSSEGDGAAEPARLYRSRLIDGVIVGDTVLHDRRIEELLASAIPFVAFGRTVGDVDYPWVDVDNRYAMALCVRHLVEHGHRSIGYVDGAADTFYGNERREGFQEALAATGMPADQAHVLTVGNNLAEARARTEQLLLSPQAPTALIAESDYLAGAVLEAGRRLGLPLGRDGVAVIGFDDTPLATLVSPSLTTIQQPVGEVARILVDTVIGGVVGLKNENRLLKPRLVVRDSA